MQKWSICYFCHFKILTQCSFIQLTLTETYDKQVGYSEVRKRKKKINKKKIIILKGDLKEETNFSKILGGSPSEQHGKSLENVK